MTLNQLDAKLTELTAYLIAAQDAAKALVNLNVDVELI
jgi:hypothetical protein